MTTQYTALHAPRENEKAVHLYQLLRINESPIDVRCKQLDHALLPGTFSPTVVGVSMNLEKFH